MENPLKPKTETPETGQANIEKLEQENKPENEQEAVKIQENQENKENNVIKVRSIE